ncbi:MAG: CoA-acylating methylmalonate-semialdehyde dehydrogenase [Chromatiales bacterium]|nr:CoA-acylating methylmalonate-semialdehyde dehydrogenase [Chromatiales bacterium]
MSKEKILNYVNGKWVDATSGQSQAVVNPATQEVLAEVALSNTDDVQRAADVAHEAYLEWRKVPSTERIQYLFKLKTLLEENLDALARTITLECGKTYNESAGELRRAIENVEVACGIPTMMMGSNVEDIARGIDEHMIRQPLGVVAIISPFNFPGMIPFWFLPYAIATGNTVILKPSERVPMTMKLALELIAKTGLPDGVVNLVNGGKEAVDAILDYPAIRAVSFVGSTEVARYIYSRGAANGKRVQCQGGAKNPIVIMPDADPELTTQIVADSGFGCAGQRCLATSLVITVGEAKAPFTEALVETARARKVGFGLDAGTQVGPVITPESKSRITGLIGKAIDEGATALVDGRACSVDGFDNGNFLMPTILDNMHPDSEVAGTEIFGPVLGLMHAADLDQAIDIINGARYGNMACIFTESGGAARKFRNEADAGNIGINIGVAAPMAFFPFSGWNDSFFGDLHAQGSHAIEFYTQTKVIVERWPKEWSRRF